MLDFTLSLEENERYGVEATQQDAALARQIAAMLQGRRLEAAEAILSFSGRLVRKAAVIPSESL